MLSRKPRGFTLVELMSVVAIIGVLGAVAMATMSGGGNAQDAAALARSLQFAMMSARTAALSDGFQHRLDCHPATVGSYCTVEKACQAGMTLPASCAWSAESTVRAASHAAIWSVSDTTDYNVSHAGAARATAAAPITFYPDGSADPTGKTIYVSDSNGTNAANQYKVYVYSATAMARLVNQW